MDIKDIPITGMVQQNLYETRTYTDQGAGTIFRQIPITLTGDRDPMRQEAFGGAATLLVRGQPIPITFVIEGATSLEQAISMFPDAVRAAIAQMRDNALRQQLASPTASSSRIDLSKIRN